MNVIMSSPTLRMRELQYVTFVSAVQKIQLRFKAPPSGVGGGRILNAPTFGVNNPNKKLLPYPKNLYPIFILKAILLKLAFTQFFFELYFSHFHVGNSP